MLEAYTTNLAVTTNSAVTFATKNIQTGITAVLETDNATIDLNRPGIYRIDFNASGGTTAEGIFSFELYANGIPVARAEAMADTAAGDVTAISFSTLVAVSRAMAGSTAKLQVMYTGGAGNIEIGNVIVTKIA